MTAKRAGRPPVWTDEKRKAAQNEICERIAQGESLTAICKDAHTPHYITTLRWLNEEPQIETARKLEREGRGTVLDDGLGGACEWLPNIYHDLPTPGELKEGKAHADQR